MKKALIVGMARSGVSSARLLAKNGWHVIVNDNRSEVPGMEEALLGIEYENALGEPPEMFYDGLDLMVLSPGVSMFQAFIEKARERNIEIIGEIELGYRYAKGDFLCITGTNGKTTCTALTGEICGRTDRNTLVLGNIGTPLTKCAMDTKENDFVVVETAALQLEGNKRFHAHVAAVTNITEDHLDRFLTMDYYIACKCRIFDNQTADDYAVLNYDDPIVRAMKEKTPAKVLYFSRREKVDEGVYVDGDEIRYAVNGKAGVLMKVNEVRIPGMHNLENAMLCAAIGLSQDIAPKTVAAALKEFPGVEHRIEYVAEVEGVRYINDSKGTNPDSTIQAIRSMNTPTVLLLGGYDKHSTFSSLFKEMKKLRIKEAVLLGETADKLLQFAKEAGYQNVHVVRGPFLGAVEKARSLAQKGDTVLLSPACASWDMFENFEERGRVFKEIVKGFQS
ncbi:UDP-N-acetylmuramoyl-L-alanine--D-glutamate ligase [Christensenellaceae bacterium OttesenSCG-928-M15]|nr:UDP-N-acetylmuramoyl-L-alanine--D-glutamate ligase [Christensenellaceae bacterium OttesenSCG-928-M15]